MLSESGAIDHERRKKLVNWAICGVLVVAGALLIIDHWAHVMGVAPYLLLLACPLMHLFGHRGHGGHHHPQRADGKKEGA